MKSIFIALMLFLPGLTFPLTTIYYNEKGQVQNYFGLARVVHIVISVAIYHGSVWMFSAEGKIEHITIFAGLLGSFTFQAVTKYWFKTNMKWSRIALTAIISGLAFMPYNLIGKRGILMGLAVFVWTIANGQLLNTDYHAQSR